MVTWLSAGLSSPLAWTLVTPQPGQGPSQSVNTNLTPAVATFNIRLLTDIMSISPGSKPTYLYSSQCNVGDASQLAKCGRKLELFLVIYNKIWKLHSFFLLNICNLFWNVGTFNKVFFNTIFSKSDNCVAGWHVVLSLLASQPKLVSRMLGTLPFIVRLVMIYNKTLPDLFCRLPYCQCEAWGLIKQIQHQRRRWCVFWVQVRNVCEGK